MLSANEVGKAGKLRLLANSLGLLLVDFYDVGKDIFYHNRHKFMRNRWSSFEVVKKNSIFAKNIHNES